MQGLTGLQEVYIRTSEESWRIVHTAGELLEWHPIKHMERHGETTLSGTGLRLLAKRPAPRRSARLLLRIGNAPNPVVAAHANNGKGHCRSLSWSDVQWPGGEHHAAAVRKGIEPSSGKEWSPEKGYIVGVPVVGSTTT
ncbi:MAG: hypothetical protein ACUVTG_15325 [Candidatus Oleimicrobiaceae bacterium]